MTMWVALRPAGTAMAAWAMLGVLAPAAHAAPASHARHATHHRSHKHARLAPAPAAPVAAAQPPAAGPAPVPDEAVRAPIDHATPETSVAPSVFQLHYPPQGDGYTTGSSSQALDDREAAKATGVEVKVPLPQ